MQAREDHASWSGPQESLRAPQLSVEKTAWLDQFTSSIVVLARGPVPPKDLSSALYFRDVLIDQRFPKVAVAVAIALQILLILFHPPLWNVRPPRVVSASAQTELTWYGPVKDFPLLLPKQREPKVARKNDTAKKTTQPGADAFHPRQTIVSEPLHPNHPRQALIQPAAPQEPPKILPAIPNIVQLAGSEPARPKMQLTPEQLAAMKPRTLSRLTAMDAAAPDVSTAEKLTGVVNIATSVQPPAKPAMPVTPMSAPRAAPQNAQANNAAPPDAGGNLGSGNTLIALSATPAPVAPPPVMPSGNLSARVSISPDGAHPGAPGTSVSGAGGGGKGPEGIFITGGNSANTAPVSGLGIGSSARGPVSALPSRPVSRARIAPESSSSPSSDSGSANAAPKLGMLPEEVLGPKLVYTLHVNMPNLTSASGSWVLNFAELNEDNSGPHIKPETPELTAPVPLRKVDPKYPPELRAAHVDGEVILYAIIRKDGSVDSIQLVHSVDPHLDANAMDALAQWKFRPAEKRGQPVDLEAVVHIPFHSRGPAF